MTRRLGRRRGDGRAAPPVGCRRSRATGARRRCCGRSSRGRRRSPPRPRSPSGRSASCAATRPGAGASRRPSPRPARVARADGVDLTPEAQWEIIDAMPPALTSSTARDIAAGRPSELDAITGAAVRAGAPARASPRRCSKACSPKRRTHAERHRTDPGALRLGARQGQERPPARGTSAARVRDRDRAAVGHLRPRRLLDRQRQDRARSRSATAPTSRSCVPRSSRRRPRPTSSGSRTRSTSSASTTTCSRSSARPIRSAGPTSCSADCSSCSQRPRPTRSARSSSSSSTPGRCGSSTAR